MNLRVFLPKICTPLTIRHKRVTMVTVPQNQEFQNDSLRYENLQKRRKMKNHFYDYLCTIQILRVKTLNMQVKKVQIYQQVTLFQAKQ